MEIQIKIQKYGKNTKILGKYKLLWKKQKSFITLKKYGNIEKISALRKFDTMEFL